MALPNNPTQAQVVNEVKTLDNNAVYNAGTLSTVAGSSTSGSVLSVRWYNSGINGITAPYDGMKIMIKIPLAGVSTGGVILSINGNNANDYHPVAYNVSTVLTTHYAVNSYKIFTYDASASMTCYKTAGTSTTITGVWKGEANYDSNNYACVRQYQHGSNAAGSGTKYPILTRYNLTNKNGTYDTAYSRFHTGVTIDTSNGNLDAPTMSENGIALSSRYLPNFILNISHQTAGNPRQVKFLTVNYATAATYFKMSATSCHDNGSSYQFLEDIIIGCTTSGTVVCNVYKYCQQAVTLDNVTRNYGDVFYVIDTTNKIVDFYILCGQYASSQFTRATKIGNTTIAYITQHTGTATYYSSGTKVWADGDSALYVRTGDLKTVNGNSLIGSGDLTVSADLSTCLKNNVNGTIVGSSSDTALFLQSKSTGSFIGFKNSNGTTLGYLGVNSSKKPIFYDTADRELALKSDIPTSYVSSVNGQTGAVTVPSMPFTLTLVASTTSNNGIDLAALRTANPSVGLFLVIPYGDYSGSGANLYPDSTRYDSPFFFNLYTGNSAYVSINGTVHTITKLSKCRVYKVTF